MKKFALIATIITAAALAACTTSTTQVAAATKSVQSAVINPQAAINSQAVAGAPTTVASLANLRDESMVRLTGKITKALGDEKYEFVDATGAVIVEIDNEDWQGRTVTANDIITIVGELDVEYLPTKHMKVDVDFVEFK